MTKEEYEFIKFVNACNSPVLVNGITILKRWGLRDAKRIMKSLEKQQVLHWDEKSYREYGNAMFLPITRGIAYLIEICYYQMGE